MSDTPSLVRTRAAAGAATTNGSVIGRIGRVTTPGPRSRSAPRSSATRPPRLFGRPLHSNFVDFGVLYPLDGDSNSARGIWVDEGEGFPWQPVARIAYEFSGARMISEREARAPTLAERDWSLPGSGRSRAYPDLVVVRDDEAEAVELELHAKSPTLWSRKLEAYAGSTYRRATYWLPDRSLSQRFAKAMESEGLTHFVRIRRFEAGGQPRCKFGMWTLLRSSPNFVPIRAFGTYYGRCCSPTTCCSCPLSCAYKARTSRI